MRANISLSTTISRRNFFSLLWHAGFLAFAQNFMDIDTIVPAMLVDAGGDAVHIGIMTSIMLGGSSFTQLIFAPFISNYHFKKPFLLLGINSRIFSLLGLGLILYFSFRIPHSCILWLIFISLTVFSLGGAFANISYTDILGKSVIQDSRKSFFTIRKVITGVILFFAALLAKKVLTQSQYPVNYAFMFFIAFGALLIASLGFWNLKEATSSKMVVRNPGHFVHLVKREILQNRKLIYFLGFINTMGISITLLPFVILYAKEFFHTQSADTGSFLLYKVIGSVSAALGLFLYAGKYKYRYLLYGSAALAFFLPLFIMFSVPFFAVIFILGGVILAIYSISMNGILLEISANENRALYTGIAGAGNILPAVFPLAGGWIISQFGYQPFFIIFMAIILSSLYFIYKINCKK